MAIYIFKHRYQNDFPQWTKRFKEDSPKASEETEEYKPQDLEDIEEEGDGIDPNTITFFTGKVFKHQETVLVQMHPNDTVLGEGSFGKVTECNGFFLGSKGIKEHKFAVKSAINGENLTGEYKNIVEVNLKTKKNERRFVVPVYGAISSGSVVNQIITDLYSGSLCKGKNLSRAAKEAVCRNVLKSLHILLIKGYILSDTKIDNILFRKGSWEAILADYGSLTKLLGDKPTEDEVVDFDYYLSLWTPRHLLMAEYHEMRVLTEQVIMHEDNKKQWVPPTQEEVQRVNQGWQKVLIFCVGSSLYTYFTGQTPYPRVMCNTLPAIMAYEGDCLKNFDTQVAGYHSPKSLEPYCDKALASLITRMISVSPLNRPPVEEFKLLK